MSDALAHVMWKVINCLLSYFVDLRINIKSQVSIFKVTNQTTFLNSKRKYWGEKNNFMKQTVLHTKVYILKDNKNTNTGIHFPHLNHFFFQSCTGYCLASRVLVPVAAQERSQQIQRLTRIKSARGGVWSICSLSVQSLFCQVIIFFFVSGLNTASAQTAVLQVCRLFLWTKIINVTAIPWMLTPRFVFPRN